MKLNDISIKWQLVVVCFLFVSIPVVCLGLLSYRSASIATDKQITQQLEQTAKLGRDQVLSSISIMEEGLVKDINMAYFIVAKGAIADRKLEIDETQTLSVSIINQETKESEIYSLPIFKINEEQIYDSTNLVDKIKANTETETTIFQIFPKGMLRISTTVTKDDGNRAIGTYIPTTSPVYQKIMSGQDYVGEAKVLNQDFLVAYRPLKDSNGKVIGAVFVGIPIKNIKEAASGVLNKKVIGKSGYFYILGDKGDYVLSLDRKRDGEIIWEAKDANGKLFIQEIIGKAKNLKEEETAKTMYPWKNTGESTARDKIAVYVYYPRWGWTIAASAYYDDFTDGLKDIRNSTIIVMIVAIIIGTILAYLFAVYMTSTFKKLVILMNKVAEGDLTIEVDEKFGKNEIGQLAKAFKLMLTNLKHLVSNIITNANGAAATAEELSASSEEVNASTEQVSSTIQEIAKGGQNLSKSANDTKLQTDSLAQSVKSVANSAQVSAKKANEASKAAKEGGDAAKKAGEKMSSISNKVNSLGDLINDLGTKTTQINKIIEVINGISEQTNLLALNAAIEAARAGDAGRGFAVVADEVRKLAEESRKATKQIEVMITDIKDSTTKAIDAMKLGTKEVDEGTVVVDQALKSLELIDNKVNDVAGEIEMISAATQEQLVNSERVQKSIGDVSAVAEESAAASEEVSASIQETTASMTQVATAAQTLARSADELKQMIAQFKTDTKIQGSTTLNQNLSTKLNNKK